MLNAGATYHYYYEVDGVYKYDYSRDFEKVLLSKYPYSKPPPDARTNEDRKAQVNRITANVLVVPPRMQQQTQQCDAMTTCSASSSYESSSTLSDLSDNAADNPDNFIHGSTTPMIWWPETDPKAKPKLTKRAKHCETPSTKRVTFSDVPSFNFFKAGAQCNVTCC